MIFPRYFHQFMKSFWYLDHEILLKNLHYYGLKGKNFVGLKVIDQVESNTLILKSMTTMDKKNC